MRKTEKVFNVSMVVLVIMVMVVIYFPIYWIITMAFKNLRDIMELPPKLFFFNPILDNFRWIFTHQLIVDTMVRSLIVASVTTLLSLGIGMLGGYAFARFNFKGKKDLEFYILTTRMLPLVAVIIPYMAIWYAIGWVNDLRALIVMYLVTNLPLAIWLSSRFFQQVPEEIEDAALVDGCTPLKAFINVALPLALPGLAVTGVLIFIFTWNEFFFAFVLTSTNRTLPVAIGDFTAHGHEIKWGSMAALALIASCPAIIVSLVFRELIVKGFSTMMVK